MRTRSSSSRRGLDDPLVYPNGISTSLPADVQQQFVRSIAGLERAEIVRPGYAVEYEFVDPRRLEPNARGARLAGLFLAGQINGTTGYEEAAAQGLVAGLNAAAVALDLEEVRFDRRSSYIGVMVDDLTLQGVSEPYRMMTARAEYRLSLRADNATSRLGERRSGWLRFGPPARADRRAFRARGRVRSWVETRRRAGGCALCALCRAAAARVGSRAARLSRLDSAGLRLCRCSRAFPTRWSSAWRCARPETLDQASRVPGVTPAALSALLCGRTSRRGGVIEELARGRGRHVSRETFEKLQAYAALLREENQRQNLVSASTLDRSVGPPHPRFGAVGAVRAASRRVLGRHRLGRGTARDRDRLPGRGPGDLVEPRRLRAEFLHKASRIARIRRRRSCRRKAERVEGKFDVITARAVAPLAQLLEDIRTSVHKKNRLGASEGPQCGGGTGRSRSARGKVRSTWNGASPTPIAKSSSQQR